MTKIFSNAHEIEWSQRENGHNIKDFICSYYLYIKFYTASRVLTRNQLPTICNEFQFNLHVIVVQCTLNVFFRQIKLFIRFHLAFVLGFRPFNINFTKINQIIGLKLKTKG